MSESYKEKKHKLGLRIDTHSFKSNLITYYKDGQEITKKRSVVTLEYKGGHETEAFNDYRKSEGNSVTNITVQQ